MKQAMSASDFCRYVHENDIHTFLFSTCNQAPRDPSVGLTMVFDSVFLEPCVGLLSFTAGRSSMRIQNVLSVSIDTDFTVLGTYVIIHSQSPAGLEDRHFIFLMS